MNVKLQKKQREEQGRSSKKKERDGSPPAFLVHLSRLGSHRCIRLSRGCGVNVMASVCLPTRQGIFRPARRTKCRQCNEVDKDIAYILLVGNDRRMEGGWVWDCAANVKSMKQILEQWLRKKNNCFIRRKRKEKPKLWKKRELLSHLPKEKRNYSIEEKSSWTYRCIVPNSLYLVDSYPPERFGTNPNPVRKSKSRERERERETDRQTETDSERAENRQTVRGRGQRTEEDRVQRKSEQEKNPTHSGAYVCLTTEIGRVKLHPLDIGT